MKRRTFGEYVKCKWCSVALRAEEIGKHERKCHKRRKSTTTDRKGAKGNE